MEDKSDIHSKGKKSETGKGIFSYTTGIIKQARYAKTFVITTVLFGVLYTFLYGIWRIPGIDFGINRTSEIGILDYTYLTLISVFTGFLVSLIKFEKTQNIKSTKLAGSGGFLAAIFAGVCPACQGIQILALGSTILSIPLAFLVPYIGLLQIITLLLLGFAVFLKSNTIYTKACITCIVHNVEGKPGHHSDKREPFIFRSNIVLGALVILVILLFVNQSFIISAFAGASSGIGVTTLKEGFEYGPKTTLKPMPLASGEAPRIQSYKSIVKALPTISEMSMVPSTGDITQDIINNVIPHGTAWYSEEAGVNFDDPIAAQKLWAKGRSIQLDAQQQQRWNRIVNSFTCDYCCGSPQQPTIITRCGCAHSQAAQGMAKWFIKNYGDKYSDEEIYGEMARWYALWYPGPTVKRILLELQAN